MDFPGLVVKNPPTNAGDMGSIPDPGRLPEEGNGNPLQYSCLENPMDRGAWWATAMGSQRVEHQTPLNDSTTTMCLYSQLLKWNCSPFSWGPETIGANYPHISRAGSCLSVTFPRSLGKFGKYALCRTEWTDMSDAQLKIFNGKRQAGSLL